MKKRTGLLALLVLANAASASVWTSYNLPNTTANFNTWSLGHASDGAFVYAENGSFYKQDAFGAGAYTAFANSPGAGTDPSFISSGGANVALMGVGGFGSSGLHSFDPSNTGTTFDPFGGVSLQNYAGHMRDANSAYIIGGNGTSGSNNLTYVTSGGVTKTLINDISQWSCGFAMDADGNLYVGDNDDGSVYYFAKTQLDAAIGGSALEVSDGAFVANFGSGGHIGSLAVDENGVLWGAGYAANGITSYDQSSGGFHSWTPGFETSHYLVDSFYADGTNYVGFASASGFASGSQAVYGFATAEAIPEPGTVTLLAGAFGGMLWFRRRRRYFFRG